MLYVGMGILGLMLLAGGGLYAYRENLRSKPSPMWVPITLRPDISMEDQKRLAVEIEENLGKDDTLRQVVIDMDLQVQYGLPDQDAAVKELERRLFVKISTEATPEGNVPSINVGVRGTGREKKISGDAATRIARHVWRMLGIDPETGLPLGDPSLDVDPAGTF